MANFHIEKWLFNQGYRCIAGVDEAGRGALFGPVVAACVLFSPQFILKEAEGWVKEIDDSKSLSSMKRERLAKEILTHAWGVGIGLATSTEIDQKNIYWASLGAMTRAVQSMPVAPDFLLVDGFNLNDVNYPQAGVSQGDKISISIAAASIVAKVMRDEMMYQMDVIYEGYSFAKNKGYGTKEHYVALKKMGPTPLHRFTFNLGQRKK